MDVETAIRTRRTHKAYGPEPVPRGVVEELLALARWAPNHHLTEPWRFRVLGAETLERLIAAGEPSEAAKLRRAPTLVVASSRRSGDPHADREDVLATAAAVYVVLLAAHARGLASYWRTPGILRTAKGREAVGVGDGERILGLLHLGAPEREPAPREREPVDAYVSFLD